jgi:hypothetical protein
MRPAVAIGQQRGTNTAEGIRLWKNQEAKAVIEENFARNIFDLSRH